MNIIVRKSNEHFDNTLAETLTCLGLLQNNISDIDSILGINSIFGLIELINDCTKAGIPSDRIPPITKVYRADQYKGVGWVYYMVDSSEDDGTDTHHSVIIVDDDTKAVQLKLILS